MTIISKILGHGASGSWSWFGIFLPSWFLDTVAVVCLRWQFFQPRSTTFRPRTSSEVDDANTGWLFVCQSA